MENIISKVNVDNTDYILHAEYATKDASGNVITDTYATKTVVDNYNNGLMLSTDKKKLDAIESGAQKNVQSDWTQNDLTSMEFVKNRPFYDGAISITWDGVTSGHPAHVYDSSNYLIKLTDATFTDAELQTAKFVISENGTTTEVSISDVWENRATTSALTGIFYNSKPCVYVVRSAGTFVGIGTYFLYNYSSKIYIKSLTVGDDDSIKKIDAKYLPSHASTATTYGIGTGSNYGHVKLSDSTSSSSAASDGIAASPKAVKAAYDLANGKMDKTNPTGTGSFSLNRLEDSTVGNFSFAEGIDTVASGGGSHAEGYKSQAQNLYSHAEGYMSIASGKVSHSEGAGAEATGDYQHAQGRYNIADTSYAHIVGNGESDTARSNAHTLDWDGNAWFQGDVYIGSTSGTNKDDGSKKLATEEYVDANAVHFVAKDSFTTTAGNGTSGSYLSTKWSVAGVDGITTPFDGMKVAVRVPAAGVSTAGIVMSINGTSGTYYPVVRLLNSAITNHYAVNSTMILTFNASQTATAYLTSNTATTVTGCWQIGDYDSNTKTTTGTSNKTGTKLYLAGATSQSSSGTTTYSNNKVYIGTDNCLYSNGAKVLTSYTDTNTTYTLTKDGSTITLTGSDGSTTSVSDSNTTYSLSSFGVTATAEELNKLDGVTATATELNYVDGVTSAIQTQLNGKVPTSRTVNNKALSSNISLTAADVGAAPAYTYGTTDLTAGSSTLETGTLYFVYE